MRNLHYMAKFAELFFADEITQEPLAQITWYHHITLMDKVKDHDVYLWYAAETVKNGWSRNVMAHQIESGLYQRQVLAEKISNCLTCQRLWYLISEFRRNNLARVAFSVVYRQSTLKVKFTFSSGSAIVSRYRI